jgi:hypothetical protein
MGCRERWPQLFDAMADFNRERQQLAGSQGVPF